jgi:hypothetical protein
MKTLIVLLMTMFVAIDGQPLVMPLIVVFVVALAVSATLAWVALWPRQRFGTEAAQPQLREIRPTF